MDSMHETARAAINQTPPEALLARLGDQTIRDALVGATSELGL